MGMLAMMLLVDVGNTQTTIGVAASAAPKGSYAAKWRITTDKSATSDDILSKLLPLLSNAGIEAGSVSMAAVASVVPALEVSWEHAIQRACEVNAVRCCAQTATEAGLFDADYPNPHEIGSDRVADAIAARAEFGAPIVVVDFGTATNIEVVDSRGRFIGGIIAPGITTGADALFSSASMISSTAFSVPSNPIGRSTAEAVCSGVILGEVNRVDGLLGMVFAQIGCRSRVVATGGLVHAVGKISKSITDISPDLTLDGLRMLVEKTAGRRVSASEDRYRDSPGMQS